MAENGHFFIYSPTPMLIGDVRTETGVGAAFFDHDKTSIIVMDFIGARLTCKAIICEDLKNFLSRALPEKKAFHQMSPVLFADYF
ncbi:hypothetical protein [Paenibacillus pinisoli]|uniref:hypothetical protein n=1 Tax=Paenibacillus pinisoli TaxID=1276110 RepID=UPI001403DC81|nr:hypothetical protein [Paenibacillus pinisoli]